MADAKRDQNRVCAFMGVSSVDGVTPVPAKVDAATGYLLVRIVDITTGSASNVNPAKRDENRVTNAMGVSSVDGVTPVSFRLRNGYLAMKANSL